MVQSLGLGRVRVTPRRVSDMSHFQYAIKFRHGIAVHSTHTCRIAGRDIAYDCQNLKNQTHCEGFQANSVPNKCKHYLYLHYHLNTSLGMPDQHKQRDAFPPIYTFCPVPVHLHVP